jgi:cellulose synthase/poly-beta-1,6-N-acetylglucosamine synthase-like glycosyltransferase
MRFPLLAHLVVVSYGLIHEFDTDGTLSKNELCKESDELPPPVSASSLLQKASSSFPIVEDVQSNEATAPQLNISSGRNISSGKRQPHKQGSENVAHQTDAVSEESAGIAQLKSVPSASSKLTASLTKRLTNVTDGLSKFASVEQNTVDQQATSSRTMSTQTKAASSIVLCVMLLALCVPWPQKAETAYQGSEKRDMLLDNAKVFAQFLVIYMHVFASDPEGSDWSRRRGFDEWRRAADLSKSLHEGFSAIAVPMLCFISGMCSQGPTTERKLRRFVWNLLVPALIWVYFAKPVILDSLIDPDPQAFMARIQAVWNLQSFHDEWYLQALVIWRGSVLLLWSHLHPLASAFSMFGLSAVAGYLKLAGPLWSLDSVFGFLPYFAIGYVFPYDTALTATGTVNLRKCVPEVVGKGFVVLSVLLWVFVLLPLAGMLPDGHGNYNCCTAGAVFRSIDAVDHSLYWTRRLARVVLELIPTLMLLLYVLPRHETMLSWIGPHTIYPYLFHTLANRWRNYLVHVFVPRDMLPTTGPVGVLILCAPYAIAVLAFFASAPWRMLFCWCFKPRWLSIFLKNEPDHLIQHSTYSGKTAAESSIESKSFEEPDATEPELNSKALQKARFGAAIKEKVYAPEEDDAASVESIPELPPSRPTYRSVRWHSTGPEIPWQSHARPYYPLLAPIFIALFSFATCLSIYVVLLVFPHLNAICQIVPIFVPVLMLVVALIGQLIVYVMHYFRLRGSDQEPESSTADPLTHAVIVCAYKEPLDVLIRTFESMAKQRGIWKRLIIVFAAEARDESAEAAYEELARRFGHNFDRIMLTMHTLAEGETIGKSSNENFAGQELYRRLVEEEGRDPFEVLVTVVDADSILSPTYLAHAETFYRRQRDGRRLIYSGPLNTYRNFADAGFLVQSHEMHRCHDDTFMCPFMQYAPLSNYSLSLGFLQEIDFWTPDVMPEDIHTANRAMLNSFGSRTTVPIPSIICNDLVVNFADRYTQAKRHQYGSITEFAWIMSLFHAKYDFHAWWQIIQAEVGRPGNFIGVASYISIQVTKVVFYSLLLIHWSTLTWRTRLFIGCGISTLVWNYFCFGVAEVLLWNTLLDQFPIKKPSPGRWLMLVLTMPLVSSICSVALYVVPTLDCLWQITFKGELVYVCAPKGDSALTAAPSSQNVGSSGGTCTDAVVDDKPSKSCSERATP